MTATARALAAERRAVRDQLDDPATSSAPGAKPRYQAKEWPAWPGPDAIRQPPKPQIQPSHAIAHRAAETQAEPH